MTGLDEIVLALQGQITLGFLVFLRLSAFFALLPGFGEQSVPTRIKLGLALAMTVIVTPAVSGHLQIAPPVPMIFTEIVTGAMFGIGLRLFVMALQTAGAIAAQATSLSQLLGGSASEPLPAMGHIMVISGLALAVMTGLHIKAAQFFILTYDLVPAGTFPRPSIFSEWGVGQVANAFKLAFGLAAPFVILSVIYNLTLGAINRAMPQLMVAFVGAPLITAGGLFLLFLTTPLIIAAWLHAMDAFLAAPFGSAS